MRRHRRRKQQLTPRKRALPRRTKALRNHAVRADERQKMKRRLRAQRQPKRLLARDGAVRRPTTQRAAKTPARRAQPNAAPSAVRNVRPEGQLLRLNPELMRQKSPRPKMERRKQPQSAEHDARPNARPERLRLVTTPSRKRREHREPKPKPKPKPRTRMTAMVRVPPNVWNGDARSERHAEPRRQKRSQRARRRQPRLARSQPGNVAPEQNLETLKNGHGKDEADVRNRTRSRINPTSSMRTFPTSRVDENDS